MHPILAKIDDLDATVGMCGFTTPEANHLRGMVKAFRADVEAVMSKPLPGSTTIDHGAKITHRPDLVDTERARQAAMQGDADRGGYLPVREALAKATHADATGGTIQAPEPERPAEPATIGIETR